MGRARHRLLHRFFTEHPPAPGARSAQLRKAVLGGVPYLRDLCADGDADARIHRFLLNKDLYL